jgi:hypothetical protein
MEPEDSLLCSQGHAARPFAIMFIKDTPLGHSLWCSLRACHRIIRYHVHKGMPLNPSLLCSQRARRETFFTVLIVAYHYTILWRVQEDHATGPFNTVFTNGMPLDISLPCWQRKRHWTICYRFTRAWNWTIHYLIHKGHDTGAFVTLFTNDTTLDHSLSFPKGHTTGSFGQPIQYSRHIHTAFLEYEFNIFLSIFSHVSQMVLPI